MLLRIPMKRQLSSSSLASKKQADMQADMLMLLVLVVYGIVAVVIAFFNQHHQGQFGQAIIASIVVGGLGGLGFLFTKGQEACRYVMAVSLMLMVALHIHYGMGLVEFHFGVFVTLALLLMYRDWKPVLVAAVVIALHHVIVDRLQAAGFDIFCLEEADFKRIMIHAAYVVVQTGFQIHIALMLQKTEYHSYYTRDDLQQTMQVINQTIHEVKTRSDNVFTTAVNIAETGSNLEVRTESASNSLEQTSSSISQLSESIEQMHTIAKDASDLASVAAKDANDGKAVVEDVVGVMADIETSSSKISAITEVINGISFQTNILALNAAVEAARAGEQGRGFAVVASEVRSLAQRAGVAAKEIEELINDSVQHMKKGVSLVKSASTSISHMTESVEKVQTLVSDISLNTEVQSDNLLAVNQKLTELDHAISENRNIVQISARASDSLRENAEQLNGAVSRIERHDDNNYESDDEIEPQLGMTQLEKF